MKENRIERKKSAQRNYMSRHLLRQSRHTGHLHLALILVQLPSMEEKDNSKSSYRVAENVNSFWGVGVEEVGYTTHSFSRNHPLHSLE